MLPAKKKILFLTGILFASITISIAQHPDHKKIDSLIKILPTTQGIQRIDCINAIGIEYWWPSMTAADTISRWAGLAYAEAQSIGYKKGRATSLMLLGVAEIFRKHFPAAETYLRQSINIFEDLQNDYGLGWANVWLGHALYSQDNFEEALVRDKKSATHLEKLGDWEGEGKTWAWIGMIYATLGNYDSSFYYSNKSLAIRKKMSDHLCVTLSFFNMGQLYKAAGSYEDALDYYNQGFQYANAQRK